MSTRVCIAGVTGWTGSSIARAVLVSSDFLLVSGVSRKSAGENVAGAIGSESDTDLRIVSDVGQALAASPDVLIDYTHPSVVMSHVMAAVEAGVAVVIGTSGLTGADFEAIEAAALAKGVGVVAGGNFSVTAALMKHFAGIAARHVPHWELVDYAHSGKPDAPSGTARELAEYLGTIAVNQMDVAVDAILGEPGTRGAEIGGAQVHSVRLPGYVLSVEAHFGLPGERLSIRHDAGNSAEPYVAGTLLAARHARSFTGLTRGLDALLFPTA